MGMWLQGVFPRREAGVNYILSTQNLRLCRGVHAKCNFPLPEEEAYQAQLQASQQESWQHGQASPTSQVVPAASHAAFSEAVCIPGGASEQHAHQPQSVVQVGEGSALAFDAEKLISQCRAGWQVEQGKVPGRRACTLAAPLSVVPNASGMPCLCP